MTLGGLLGLHRNGNGGIEGCFWLNDGVRTGNAPDGLGACLDQHKQPVAFELPNRITPLDAAGFRDPEAFRAQGWNFDSMWEYSDGNNRERPLHKSSAGESGQEILPLAAPEKTAPTPTF